MSHAAVSCFHIGYHLLAHDVCESPCRRLVEAISLGSDFPGFFYEAVSFIQILLRDNGVAVALVVMVAIFAEGAGAVLHEHLHRRAAASLPLVVADMVWAETRVSPLERAAGRRWTKLCGHSNIRTEAIPLFLTGSAVMASQGKWKALLRWESQVTPRAASLMMLAVTGGQPSELRMNYYNL